MAAPKKANAKCGSSVTANNPPTSLEGHIFYGYNLDDSQREFRNMIYDPKKQLIFCQAKAGSGKTTIAIMTSVLMVEYGMYDHIIYVMHPVGDAQGFLPGTITEKSSVWFEPLYQALIEANKQPGMVINDESMVNQKNGSGFVTAVTTSYLRGTNLGVRGKTIVILDEAQNYPEPELRKALTRICEDTKVIVLGNDVQCDLRYAQSGFPKCRDHFKSKQDDRVAFCELNGCHRSFIAEYADEAW